MRLNSCVRDGNFASCSGSPAGPIRDRSLSWMAVVSVSVFLQFLFRPLQLFLRSLPSTLRDNRRDIFLDPISTTCCRPALLPYPVRVFRVRLFLGHGACLFPPV